MVFTLTPQVGDVDMDGIALLSPLDLNGGTIKDAVGNNAALTFTPPNTTGIKVNYPSLGMDFVADADGRFTLNGTVYNDLSSFLTASGGSFTRASTASYYDSTGTLQFAASNTPRFDYDPVTHVAKGLLIEESRTNLQIYSKAFSNWVNNAGLATITDNSVNSPEGVLNASTISSAAGGAGVYRNSVTVSGAVYTQSIFLKYISGTSANVRFGNDSNNRYITINPISMTISATGPSVTHSSVFNIGNGWYRFIVTWTSVSTSEPTVLYNMVGLPLNIGVYGAQIEQGSFATSYIPTTTAAATRARDVFAVPTGSWFSSSAGLMYAEADMADLSTFRAVSAFSGATTYGSARGFLMRSNSATSVAVGGNCCASALYLAHATGQAFKIAGGYSGTTAIVAANNTSSQITTNDFTGSGTTQLVLGDLQTSSAYQSIGSGHIAKFKYYPMLPAITQVQLLTQ